MPSTTIPRSLILLSIFIASMLMMVQDYNGSISRYSSNSNSFLLAVYAQEEDADVEEEEEETVADMIRENVEERVADIRERVAARLHEDEDEDSTVEKLEEDTLEETESVPVEEVIKEEEIDSVEVEESEVEVDSVTTSSSLVGKVRTAFVDVKAVIGNTLQDEGTMKKVKKVAVAGLGIWGSVAVSSWIFQREIAKEEAEGEVSFASRIRR